MKVRVKKTIHKTEIEEFEVEFPEITEYWYNNYTKDLFIIIPISYKYEYELGNKEGFIYKMILADLEWTSGGNIKVYNVHDTGLKNINSHVLNIKNPDTADTFTKLFYNIYIGGTNEFDQLDEKEGERLFKKSIRNINLNDNWISG